MILFKSLNPIPLFNNSYSSFIHHFHCLGYTALWNPAQFYIIDDFGTLVQSNILYDDDHNNHDDNYPWHEEYLH